MPHKVLALELGARELKAAVVTASFRDYQVVAFHRAAVAADGSSRSEQLKRFLVTHGLLGSTAVLSALPGDLVTWRTFFLPFRDRRKLDQTVPFELEGLVPFGLDDVVVDYQVVRRTKEGSKVLAALVRRSDLESHLALLTDAGLDPKIIDVGPLANLNVLHLLDKNLPASFVYVGGNEERLTVATFRDHELEGLRTITPTPLPVHEVDVATTSNGHPPSDHTRLQQVLADVRWTIMALLEEPLPAGSPCIIGGEGVLFEELRQAAASLGMPVRALDTASFKPVPQALRSEATNFLTPIGLALREVAPNEAMGVNFRRGEFAYHRADEETRAGLRRTLLLACAVIAIVIGHTYVEYQRLQARLEVLDRAVMDVFKQTLPDVRPGADPAAQLQSMIDAEQNKLDMLAGVVPIDGATAIDALRAVSIAIPKTLKVDAEEMIMDTGQIRFKANTDSYESVDAIKQKVAAANYFGNVEVKNVKQSPKDPQTIEFNLILDLNKAPALAADGGTGAPPSSGAGLPTAPGAHAPAGGRVPAGGSRPPAAAHAPSRGAKP